MKTRETYLRQLAWHRSRRLTLGLFLVLGALGRIKAAADWSAFQQGEGAPASRSAL